MKLSTFLEDNNGGFSAMRLALLLWVVGLLVVWLIGSIKGGGTLQEIPGSVLTLVGILTGGKAVQRFGETSDESGMPVAVAGSGIPALNPESMLPQHR